MRIKKAGILIIAAAITCTTPAVPAMAADTSESVQEIISDNEIDSLVSDPDKVVDIIMYVKNEAAKQDISDDQIRSLIQTAENRSSAAWTWGSIPMQSVPSCGQTELSWEENS